MDVREKIEAGEYENKFHYPIKPRKPIFTDYSPSAYVDALEEYEVALKEYKDKKRVCDVEDVVLRKQFKADALAEMPD